MNKTRVRFAPSPTGFLHIGGFRTALYNFLFARKSKGIFILRIEDTDKKRLVSGAKENLLKTLDWAGLSFDEGPYIQSEHLEIYQKYAHELVKTSQAYYCFCEPERLEKMKEGQRIRKQAPMYDKYCLRNVSEEEINKSLKSNCPFTIRLKIPSDEKIEFTDLIRGKVSIKTNTIDDQVLLKSDGFPTYHLANVVDDHLMEITHVIRGEEWLPSTPKHILLYRAFGWNIPEFAHLPLLLNADRSKLSKRQGDVAVEDYIKKGYLKEAIINFVALLGWNPGSGSTQEVFSLPELIEKFDLTHVHKGGAVFDLKKLDWLNSEYIKNLSFEELYERSLEFFRQKNFYQSASAEKKSEEYLKKVLTVEQDRLNNLSEVGEYNKFFFQDIDYDRELLRWKDMPDEKLKYSLQKSKESLEKNNWEDEKPDIAINIINTALNSNLAATEFGDVIDITKSEPTSKQRDLNVGEIYWPLRVALTGEKKSPPPGEVAWVLGKAETLKRLNFALNKASDLK
ncbi:MAG: glutamate--tRNA ligase [Candidatus Moranbacteria bacterium RBG_19FT_COMBO_42_6]|nr:MAG: glutamate--tRNA ligase [Candidatus Moranbacteria bacterium RBG_19FT_COMBO_42_6]